MASLKEKIYWKAPYLVKTVMASANARMRDHERFGPEYEGVLEEIAEHNTWPPERLLDYQNRKLGQLVRHAAMNVPYYRRFFAASHIEPEKIRSGEDLQYLPILDKETARSNPESFVDERLDKAKLLALSTSGTTGTPLKIYRDVKLNSAALAYFDGRCHAAANMKRRVNKSVSIGGFLVADPKRNRPPFWVENRRWNQLYMSSYHLSPQYLGHYVDQLRRFRGEYIEGYASSIYAIARYIVDNGLEPVPFKACFTTADTLFDHYRQAIQEAFCCKTHNQYGCGEMAVFAAECDRGSLHLSPEIGLVEVVDDRNRPVEPGLTGHLICTSIINSVQPFIRYRIGDIGALAPGTCACGSPLPMLAHLEGRDDAVLVTRDGRRIGRLDPVFKGCRGVSAAQIVQNDYDHFVIRIVATSGYTEKDGQQIVRNLADRVGRACIQVERVLDIERTSLGKFRAVVNKMKEAERAEGSAAS